MTGVFTESATGLVYSERLSPWARAVALGAGAALVLVPIAFLHHAAWRGLSWATLGVVLPCLLGLVFIRLGLAGVHRVAFDTRHRRLVGTRRGPLGVRRFEIGFDGVERFEVVRREGLDDPAFYEVVMVVTGRRPIRLGTHATREDAEQWQRRLQAQVAA